MINAILGALMPSCVHHSVYPLRFDFVLTLITALALVIIYIANHQLDLEAIFTC